MLQMITKWKQMEVPNAVNYPGTLQIMQRARI